MIINSGMAAFKIVGVDIFPNCLLRLTDIGILGKICFLVFKTAKPSLNHDIVSPTTFALHTLPDVIFFEKIYVFVACKFTSLI